MCWPGTLRLKILFLLLRADRATAMERQVVSSFVSASPTTDDSYRILLR